MIKTEKYVFASSVIILMVFIFAILVASQSMKIDIPECVVTDNPYTEGKVVKLDDETYQVYYVAKMWMFDPAIVEIPLGAEVDLYLTSNDVVHGFHIKEKDVNMMAVYGNINKRTVKFKKPGVYNIVCHEYCGVGHQSMRGQIVVKENLKASNENQ